MARQQIEQDPEVVQMKQQMQMMQPPQGPMPGMPGMPPQGGMPPQPNPQMQQMNAIIEAKVSQLTAQLVNQIAPAFEAKQDDDPLIGLRREELDIKAADVQRKTMEAEKRFGLDKERLDTQRELTEERIDTQLDIAEMKDETAQDRLNLQREIQMGNLAEKMSKNIFGGS